MKGKICNVKTITLTLTEEEALWLKNLVQNPLCDPSDESEYDKNIRGYFWDTLFHFTGGIGSTIHEPPTLPKAYARITLKGRPRNTDGF